MLFREASIQGRLVNLRAADDLGRYVRLLSGRLPRRLPPLALRGAPAARQRADSLDERAAAGRGRPRRLEEGRAVRAVRPARAADRADRARGALPHAAAVADRDRKRRRGPLGRTPSSRRSTAPTAGSCRSEPGDVHPWAVGAFSNKVQRLTSEIDASSDAFDVSAPTDVLGAATTSSHAAAGRLLLLGGESGALLLAFTILAAASLRRSVTEARRRLAWSGARRFQVELFALAESLALATLSTVARLGRGRRRRGGRRRTRRLARRRGDRARPALRRRRARRDRRRDRRRASSSTSRCGHRRVQLGRLAVTPLDAAAAGAVARRPRRLGARLDRRARALELRRHEHLPRPRPGARRLRRRGRRGAAARAGAPLHRARGPPRPDRAAARGGVARAAPGSRRRSPRRSSSRASGSRSSPSPTGRRSSAGSATRPTTRCRRRSSSPRTSRSSCRSCTGSTPSTLSSYRQVDRLSGNVPSGTTFSFLGLDPGTSRGRRLAGRLRVALLRLARARDHADERRRASHDATACRAAVHAAGFRTRRRRRDPGDLPLAARRLPGGRARPHARAATRRPARVVSRSSTRRLAQIYLDIQNNGRLTANAGTGIQPSARGVLHLGLPRVDGRVVPRARFATGSRRGGVTPQRRRASATC